jgi:hypothetical protein
MPALIESGDRSMAKGQMRPSREKKKPKAKDKPKAVSAYQMQYKAKPGAMPALGPKKEG